ncbi:MAG: cation:dicarboxylase symporter family transporter, partial [Sedimentisphaerales bacterium]|nr:cation:dicarboxylase symporter family transporter [Sedimentisphaerales bacterium]
MKLKIHTQIFIAIVLGILVGIPLSYINQRADNINEVAELTEKGVELTEEQAELAKEGVEQLKIRSGRLKERADYIADPLKIVGDIFIRLLKVIIIPLILASMVAGIVSLGDMKKLGRIGLKTFVYYMITTALAVGVGLILVNVISPGTGVEIGAEAAEDITDREAPSVLSIVTDIIPENLFDAMAKDKVLSIIFFSILLGVAINSIGEKGRPLAELFEVFNAVMMKITGWIMRLAPIGIFAL